MRLHYDENTEAFRARFVAWLDENKPRPEETRDRPRSSGDLPEWARRWQRRLFDAGYLVPGWPPELGGCNATPQEQMVYFEELTRRRVTRSFNIQGVTIIAPSIIDYGTDAQKQQYALPMLKGELTGCLGMSEPGAGSDLAGLSTRAELRDNVFVINGQKVWTSGAQHAEAGIFFVRTDPDAPKHKGISCVIIDMDTPGITVRSIAEMNNRERADFNEVFLDDVIVPRENLLGALGQGWAIANGSLSHERGMMWIQQASALDRALQRALTLAGDDATRARMGDNAVFRDQLASSAIDAYSLRLMGYRGFAKMTRGRVALEHSTLKLFGSEAVQRLSRRVTEALGARAIDKTLFTEDEPYLDFATSRGAWMSGYFGTFGSTISAGTSEIQRNIIAERILGLPRG